MRKIALITGAGSGIGRNAALALAKNGFSLVLAERMSRGVPQADGSIAVEPTFDVNHAGGAS